MENIFKVILNITLDLNVIGQTYNEFYSLYLFEYYSY